VIRRDLREKDLTASQERDGPLYAIGSTLKHEIRVQSGLDKPGGCTRGASPPLKRIVQNRSVHAFVPRSRIHVYYVRGNT